MGSLLHFGVVGVHHVVIVLSGLSARSVLRTRLRSFGLLGVELLGQLVRGLGQFIHGLLDGVRIIPFHDLLQGFGLAFNIRLQRGVDVLAQIADGLLRGVDERIGAVADLDELLLLLVLFGVRLRFLDQPLDIRVAQTAGGRDADGLLLARAQILGRDIDDAVGLADILRATLKAINCASLISSQ